MFRKLYLRHYGRYLFGRYLYWLDSAYRILEATNRQASVREAEALMPLLPRFRRRAKACVRLLKRAQA